MLVFCDIPLGGGDEVSCRRCALSVPRPPAGTTEPTARIDSALDATPGAGVFFSDVGPLDHSDLLHFVRHAARAGASRIAVRTSGRSVDDPAAAADLLQSGVRIVEVTFLGSGPQTHDALAGTPGAFDATATGVGNLLAAAEELGIRVAVRGRMRVCSHNLQDLPTAVMRLAEMGMSSLLLVCDSALDPRRSADWVAAACDTGTVNRVWVAVSGMDGAALGDKTLHTVDVITLTEVPA